MQDYERTRNKGRSELIRHYRLGNKSNIRESQRKYRGRNKDRVRETLQDYYLRHHDNPEIYLPRNNEAKSWKTPELARDYFESIAKQLAISTHSDWYRISRDQVRNLGGIVSISKILLDVLIGKAGL
jgi:hypothetical protein